MFKTYLSSINGIPILKSSLAIALITVLIKILGYVEKVMLAYYWGTSYKVDIYNVIITIVMAVFLFFREVIEPGFLNVFLQAKSKNDDASAWALFNKTIRLIFFLTAFLSVYVYFFPHDIISLFAPGFQDVQKEIASHIIKFAFCACVLLSLSVITNITLNGLMRFALPVLGDLAFKLTTLLTIVFLYKHFGLCSIIYALISGGIIKLVIHSIGLYKNYSLKKLCINRTYLQQAWNLTWPLLIGASLSQVSTLVDNIFASYLKEGTISALNYAKKIIEFPVLIFPYILSIVIFPYFSELVLRKEQEKLSTLFIQSMAWIIVLFLPVSIFANVFSIEIVSLIFQRGAFDANSTILTAYPLSIYSYGLVFFGIETILVIFYFANANTKTPILIGVLTVFENIMLAYLFISNWGYIGIVWAFVISKITKGIILLAILNFNNVINLSSISFFSLKTFLASLVLLLFFYLEKIVLKKYIFDGLINKAVFLFVSFVVGATIYLFFLMLIKINKKLLFN